MATGIQLAPPPRRRDPMADALMAQATDSSPKGHWLAAVAQALQGYMGGRMQREGQKEQTEQERRIAEALRGQFAGGGPSQTGDTRMAPMAAPASLATPPGAPLQPQQSPAMSVNDPIAMALMGQQPGQASFNAPPAPPDTRPQAPPLAAAMRQAGNPMGEAQAYAMALMGQGQQPEFRTAAPGTYILDAQGNPVRQLPEREREDKPTPKQRVSAIVRGEDEPTTLLYDPIEGMFTRTHGDGRIETIPSSLITQVSVQGGREDVRPPTVTGAGSPKEQQDLRDAARRGEATLSNIAMTRAALRQNPGATGVRGTVGETVGGLTGSLIGEGAEDQITRMISGTTPEQLQRTRTLAKKLTGELIPTVLNDTSGRYSDRDIERVENVQRTIDLDASPRQIDAALGVLTEVELNSAVRRARDLDIPFTYDLTDPDGVQSYGEELVSKYGFTPDAAARLIVKHRELLGGQQ